MWRPNIVDLLDEDTTQHTAYRHPIRSTYSIVLGTHNSTLDLAESTTEPFSRKYITREQPRAPIDAPAGGADRFILLERIYSKPSFLSIPFSRAERILKQKNARLHIFMGSPSQKSANSCSTSVRDARLAAWPCKLGALDPDRTI